MNTFKRFAKGLILAGLMLTFAVSCSDDDDQGKTDPDTENPDDNNNSDEKVYVLGVGVTTTEATSNYVLKTSDLMTGTISLINNGVLQVGYRDYASAGSNFYSVGGLGVTDVNTISLDTSGNLVTKTGLTFDMGASDLKDVDGTGKTLLGVAVPSSPTAGTEVQFFLVDVATNSITKKVTVPMDDVLPSAENWWGHSGIVVRGSQAFQTFYPINYTTWATNDTDATYVAIYSYPAFELQEVIKDTRTGPAGAFGTRSGIFATESGDIYTISHSGYGYSQATKEPAILKIAAGTTTFDDYYFNTEDATNGGRIVHALYIGDNKLFAEISSGDQDGQWSDAGLKFAIVDLKGKSITAVKNTPTFAGDGGRSFAATYDDGKVYTSATVDGVRSIYQIDIATATATKGATIDASFLGGIARLK